MNAAKPSFSGELGLLGLFDLGQVLMLNRATGCLTVISDTRKGFLYFHDGQLVNAVDETLSEGEGAAYRLFTWNSGRFEFRQERPSGAPLIHDSTEAIMLEAARRMDESGDAQGGTATEKLLERQDKMEALRDVFHNLAREARALTPDAARDATASALDALTRADDRMVLRSGFPARVRVQGVWREAKDASLTAAEYDDLKSHLMAGGDSERAVAQLPGGRSVQVARVAGPDGESLWLQPIGLPAHDPTRLIAPPEQMAELLNAHRGLVLIGGANPDAAARMLHAVIAGRLTHNAEALVLVRERGAYRQREAAGVLAEVEPAQLAVALATVEPPVLALDVSVLPGDGALRALAGVRLLLARSGGEPPDTMLQRWLATFGPQDRQALEAFLVDTPVLRVIAESTTAGEDTLPFRAWADLAGPSEAASPAQSRALRPQSSTARQRAA